MTELMVLPNNKKGIEKVFIEGQDIDSTITKIRNEAKNLPLDMSVRKNREEVASFAYKVARSKTAVDNAGAALSAEYKEIPKKIDANRRVYKEAFESLQAEVRQPLTEWEAAEAERVSQLESKVSWIKGFSDTDNVQFNIKPLDANQLKHFMQNLVDFEVNEEMQEYETEAHRVKAASIKHLEDQIVIAEKREAEQAELEALRKAAAEQAQKDREAQIAREAAEQARKEAEQAVQVEREKNAREVARAELEAEQAKRSLELAEARRIEQEAQAKLDIERAKQNEIDRQAAEAAHAEKERAKRQADTEHKGLYNRTAMADLVKTCGLTDEQAKAVIVAIIQNKVSNVTINY